MVIKHLPFILSVRTLLRFAASVCNLNQMNGLCHREVIIKYFHQEIFLGEEVRWLRGEASPLSPPVNETLPVASHLATGGKITMDGVGRVG